MSTTLRDFLKQKAVLYEAESRTNQATIEEWKSALDRLFDQIETWIVASDPDHVVSVERSPIEISEPGLDDYRVTRMDLRAFGKWVGMIPKARKTVKRASPQQAGAPEQATGRVDMTDEIRRYVLYRFRQGADECWFIDDVALNGEMQPLTASCFEAALMSYFK